MDRRMISSRFLVMLIASSLCALCSKRALWCILLRCGVFLLSIYPYYRYVPTIVAIAIYPCCSRKFTDRDAKYLGTQQLAKRMVSKETINWIHRGGICFKTINQKRNSNRGPKGFWFAISANGPYWIAKKGDFHWQYQESLTICLAGLLWSMTVYGSQFTDSIEFSESHSLPFGTTQFGQ